MANRIAGLDIGEKSLGWDVETEFSSEESGWAESVLKKIPKTEEDEIVLLRRIVEEMRNAGQSTSGQLVGVEQG